MFDLNQVFKDENGNSQNINLETTAGVTAISTTGYKRYANFEFRTDGSIDIELSTKVSGVGSIDYNAGATLKYIHP